MIGEVHKISPEISGYHAAKEEEHVWLPGIIQQWLAVFAFFLAFPAIDIAGLSITFYIFFIILIIHARQHLTIIIRDKTNKWFLLLFVAGTIGTLAHPRFEREVSFLSDFKTIAQFAYWILLALYIRSNFHLIDWQRVSRGLFWGLIALVIGFYLFPVRADLMLVKIHFGISRNGFVYNVLAFFPMIVLYFRYVKVPLFRSAVFLMFVLSVLLSNGRAGFILIILEALLIGIILYPEFTRIIKVGFFLTMVSFLIWQTSSDSRFISGISNAVENVNPRASEMLSKEGNEGDLTMDKSWLLRKLMVDKSLEIVRKYPILGIGWMHFVNYDAQLSTLNEYPRLKYHGREYLNTRSSHNSYAMYLAEGGIIGFVLLIIIILTALLPFFKKFLSNNLDGTDAPLVALMVLAIYFYVIAAITGANTWFIIGASLGCVRHNVFGYSE